jgi:hypothetical protein
MSITKEEASEIVKFISIKNNEFIDVGISIFSGYSHIYSYIDDEYYPTNKNELILTDSGCGEYSEYLEITSAFIENNKLHIVLETEEELLIPIRDD